MIGAMGCHACKLMGAAGLGFPRIWQEAQSGMKRDGRLLVLTDREVLCLGVERGIQRVSGSALGVRFPAFPDPEKTVLCR